MIDSKVDTRGLRTSPNGGGHEVWWWTLKMKTMFYRDRRNTGDPTLGYYEDVASGKKLSDTQIGSRELVPEIDEKRIQYSQTILRNRIGYLSDVVNQAPYRPSFHSKK